MSRNQSMTCGRLNPSTLLRTDKMAHIQSLVQIAILRGKRKNVFMCLCACVMSKYAKIWVSTITNGTEDMSRQQITRPSTLWQLETSFQTFSITQREIDKSHEECFTFNTSMADCLRNDLGCKGYNGIFLTGNIQYVIIGNTRNFDRGQKPLRVSGMGQRLWKIDFDHQLRSWDMKANHWLHRKQGGPRVRVERTTQKCTQRLTVDL